MTQTLISLVKELEAFPYDYYYNDSKNPRVKQSSVALIFRLNKENPRISYKTPSPAGQLSSSSRISSTELEDFLSPISLSKTNPIDVLFIKRKTDIKDSHSGYIALPGGKNDGFSEDDYQAAVREVREELGVELNNSHHTVYLGKFPKNFKGVYGKNSTLILVAVHLFLIINIEAVSFEISPSEVEKIVWVPLSTVTDPYESRLIYRFLDMKQLFSASFPYQLQILMDKHFKPHYKITGVACYLLDEEGNGIFGVTLYVILYLMDIILTAKRLEGISAAEEKKFSDFFNKLSFWKTIFNPSFRYSLLYHLVYDRFYHYHMWIKQYRFKRYADKVKNAKRPSNQTARPKECSTPQLSPKL